MGAPQAVPGRATARRRGSGASSAPPSEVARERFPRVPAAGGEPPAPKQHRAPRPCLRLGRSRGARHPGSGGQGRREGGTLNGTGR